MKSSYFEMIKLGLNKSQVTCYQRLFESGTTTVPQLAISIGCRPTNLYKLLHQLQTYGFVQAVKTNLGPTFYSAVPLETALDDFFVYQKREVLEIIREQRAKRPPKA